MKPAILVVLASAGLLPWTYHVRRVAFSEALYKAAQQGDVSRAKELLSWGADPNYKLEFGTPLEAATKSGNKQMIDLLSR